MTPLSPRYGIAAVLLLALALVPVLANRGGARNIEDCANPISLRDPGSWGNQARDLALLERPEKKWWSAGGVHLAGPRSPLLRFGVLRTYRPTVLYLQPFRFVGDTFEPEETRLEWLERDGQSLPVHFVFDETQPSVKMAAYFFIHGGEPVESPFRAQLAAAPRLLLEGTPPFSLFVIGGEIRRAHRSRAEDRMREWLLDAWDGYQSLCRE